ncbi:KAP family P-loop NTPase fold protein [Ruegeria sp. SCP11]|uniref:KAP family P-loop NTPase fold protein n=1 Tax=Ruegeria sp. SCP11 TaxID=3141378 RepID=UPI00333D2DDF
MRLTIPDPKIELYEDGFAAYDKLSRKPTGDKLSELVKRIDDPLVIALDGAWGSGKSFFLKCWVGEHLKRDGTTTQTVYFDAFKHDFLDDPLVALTGAIADRFRKPEGKQHEQNQKLTQHLKKTAWAVSKAAGRIGLSAVTFGATEILSDLGDEIAQAVSDKAKAFLSKETGDKQAEQFWDAHQAKIAAMDAFRLALTELTEPKEENGNERPTKKLVIVVDELDRCRPDYALLLLETIKHFFNVDGVHFVLGVNLEQLQNSVKARYGSGTEAEAYLQKFYSLKLKLPRMI